MYEVSDGRPRDPSSSPSGRELPILFHLADVSRPRAKPVEKPFEKPMGEPAHILAAVERLRPAVEPQAAVAVPPPVMAPVTEPTALPTARVEAVVSLEIAPEDVADPAATSAPVVVPEAIETKPAVDSPKAVEVAKAEVAKHSEVADTEPSAAKNAAVVHPVHLRKKPKTSASEDWFASHGKYIAIAFVVALCGTVYFARSNREKPVAKAEPAPQSPLIETITPAKSSGDQNLWPEAMTHNHKTEQAAGTPVQTAFATESKVELLAPQTVAEAPADKKRDNLFEFAAAKGEERLAARTDDGAKAAAPALATPAAPAEPTNYPITPPPPSQYPVTNAPTAYPSTSLNSAAAYPSSSPPNAPVAPPTMPSSYPAPAYQPTPQNGPSIDYRSQFPAAPAPPAQQQAWPPAGYGGQPGSYQPFDNTARGQRNERTGSGTY